VEGENSTSGPQPYQPYEAKVTNLLIVAACQKLGLKKLQIHIVVNGMSFVLEEKSADLLGSSYNESD